MVEGSVDMEKLEAEMRDASVVVGAVGPKTNIEFVTAALLVERGKTHGNFELQSKVANEILDAVFWGPSSLKHEQRHALTMIAMKMARIACGDPNFKDHWDDIAGYAKLVSDRL